MNKGKIICGLLDKHSKKVYKYMGRIYCARCDEMLVDTWTQAVNPDWLKTREIVNMPT